MTKKKLALFTSLLFAAACIPSGVSAEVKEDDTSKKYDSIINLYENLDSLNLTIKETSIVPEMKSDSIKTITIQATGLKNPEKLQVSITTSTEEGTREVYYKNEYYYSDESGELLKYSMKPETMLELVDHYIYLNFNSEVLETLQAKGNSYTFTATSSSLGEFQDKVLEGVQSDQQVSLVALQGNTQVDDDDHILKRTLQTIYTVNSGEEASTISVNSVTSFQDPDEMVLVAFPDLDQYRDASIQTAKVEIVTEEKQVYATDDLNVRASNDITSAVIGGFEAGDVIQQTALTSNGWIQINYNGTTAYVSEDYISATKPLVIKSTSGTMYATTPVNIRSNPSSEGTILGILDTGESILVNGYTNTNWIRVTYKGNTGYITRDYLTWDQPVKAMGGMMFVANEYANVRSYYSTDSNVLATLSYGDTVEVTGYTGNNWIRVSYAGKRGYIYAPLLSWSDPLNAESDEEEITIIDDNITDTRSNVRQSYGVVINSGINTITVTCLNGKTVVLDMTDATINCPSGLYNGMYVSIVYHIDEDQNYILEALDEMEQG